MKVIIYTTPTCPYCQLAKEFFKSHKIEYIEKNVADDDAALQEMMSKTDATSVPVIDINGTILLGFEEEKIRKLLGI